MAPSRDGLQVRAHDPGNAADLGVAQERPRIDTALLPVAFEGFHGRVQAELDAVLETVGQGLLAGVNAHGRAIQRVRFDSGGESMAAEPKDAHGRIVQPRRLTVMGNGQKDLVRDLRGQVVEGKGRDQANDSPGDPPRHDHQVGIAQGESIREAVKAAAEGLQDAGVSEGVQRSSMNSCPDGFRHAHDATVGAEERRCRSQLGRFPSRCRDRHEMNWLQA
jgi:hypothetical protein